jgi:small subunit ribosomal protein S17
MPRQKVRDIGIEVNAPKKTCDDTYCPFHGNLPVRGQILEGRVESDKMKNTIVVEREYLRLIPKYERYEKRTRRYLAHNPPCLDIESGDRVAIMECRPLSKTVTYVAIEKKGE